MLAPMLVFVRSTGIYTAGEHVYVKLIVQPNKLNSLIQNSITAIMS